MRWLKEETKTDPEMDEIRRRRTWAKWFAWRPVPVYDLDDTKVGTVWLEYVYRRYTWRATQDYGYWIPTWILPEDYDRLLN